MRIDYKGDTGKGSPFSLVQIVGAPIGKGLIEGNYLVRLDSPVLTRVKVKRVSQRRLNQW